MAIKNQDRNALNQVFDLIERSSWGVPAETIRQTGALTVVMRPKEDHSLLLRCLPRWRDPKHLAVNLDVQWAPQLSLFYDLTEIPRPRSPELTMYTIELSTLLRGRKLQALFPPGFAFGISSDATCDRTAKFIRDAVGEHVVPFVRDWDSVAVHEEARYDDILSRMSLGSCRREILHFCALLAKGRHAQAQVLFESLSYHVDISDKYFREEGRQVIGNLQWEAFFRNARSLMVA